MGGLLTARVDADIGGWLAIDGLFRRCHRLERCGLIALVVGDLNQDLIWQKTFSYRVLEWLKLGGMPTDQYDLIGLIEPHFQR